MDYVVKSRILYVWLWKGVGRGIYMKPVRLEPGRPI